MMAEIPKIGKAADIKAIIDDLAADSDIEELVTVRFRRDEHGELVARYDYTRTISRFRMSGAMLWAAHCLCLDDE